MCTIFAYEGKLLTEGKIRELLEKTIQRGPDGQKIIHFGDSGTMAFQRLAIMGLDENGMQPFEKDGLISCTNGEIYGFRKIKKELEAEGASFSSGSDCEIIIPLYKKYGLSLFSILDAEYAALIYDPQKGLIAARDPIGIRPLFYGYDKDGKIAFASEAKLLSFLDGKILPFPPGCYYQGGKIYRYRDIGEVKAFIRSDEKTVTDNIRKKLVAAVEKRLDSDAPLAFLLSGGLDSSLVCAIAARKMKRRIRTFSIGMEKDAIDAKYARLVANHLGAEHTEVLIRMDDVTKCLEKVIYDLATYDITTIRASMGMYLLCRYIHENTDVRVLLTGEVSDELFGYKYTDFAPDEMEFEKESQKRMRELYAYDVLRADRCIADNSIEARVPFGDLDFASYVLSIDPKMKMNHTGHGKYLLRKAFEDGNWLPQSILWRDKAAFSDAVGHSLVDELKKYAYHLYEGKDWKKECLKYPEKGRPFTPESLLYRSIFEKYYPNQDCMIPGFWMPNPSWEGCKVDDPSARVLSNYGNSGI